MYTNFWHNIAGGPKKRMFLFSFCDNFSKCAPILRCQHEAVRNIMKHEYSITSATY